MDVLFICSQGEFDEMTSSTSLRTYWHPIPFILQAALCLNYQENNPGTEKRPIAAAGLVFGQEQATIATHPARLENKPGTH